MRAFRQPRAQAKMVRPAGIIQELGKSHVNLESTILNSGKCIVAPFEQGRITGLQMKSAR